MESKKEVSKNQPVTARHAGYDMGKKLGVALGQNMYDCKSK